MSIVMLGNNSFACTPPEMVLKAFNQKFPNATNVKWDKENKNEYEAEFKWNGGKYSANFDKSGEWLETESPTTFNQLPEEVKKAFNTSYKNAKVKGVSKTETSKGKTIYEVEMKQGLKTVEKFYTADGIETKE